MCKSPQKNQLNVEANQSRCMFERQKYGILSDEKEEKKKFSSIFIEKSSVITLVHWQCWRNQEEIGV